MKKASFLLIALLLSLTSFGQKQLLSLNLTKGETYHQNSVSHVIVDEDVNGQKLVIDMTITGNISYKVSDVLDSLYVMDVEYNHIGIKMAVAGTNVESNSEKNDPNDVMSKVLASMKNVPFIISLTRTGRIHEVKNIDKLFNNIFSELQVTEAQKQQIMAQLNQSFGPESFRGSIEMTTAIFPGKPVAINDQWNVKTALQGIVNAGIENTYTLKEKNNDYILIEGSSKIVTDENAKSGAVNGMQVTYDLMGTMESQIRIDPETGWVISSSVKQDIQGKAFIADNPSVPGGMTLPMKIKSESTTNGN